MPIHQVLVQSLGKVAELVGPIIVRELGKPRTRRFIEEKVGEFATEIARRRFTSKGKKTKKSFITRRGNVKFHCRRM